MSATSTRRPLRARRPLLLAVAGVILLVALLSGVTSARAATAANYATASVGPQGGPAFTNCRSWSGDADDAGHFYMACPSNTNPYVYELDDRGVILRGAALPAEYLFDQTYRIRDVAVSPDGSTLYVSTGPIVDLVGQNPGAGLANGAQRGAVLRLRRGADSNFTHDPTFRAGPFALRDQNGVDQYWAARNVDVDASGRLYAAVNALIYEISPTSGGVVTSFGGAQTAYPGGPWVEGIDVAQGIAVSADGNSILVVEQQHHLVQRWTRVGATNWTRGTSFLIGKPSEEGDQYCQTNDHLQSPYDVGVDIAGDIYIADTSCHRIQRFNMTGTYLQTLWVNGFAEDKLHGFAVNWQGSILLPEFEQVLTRLDPPAKPAPPAPKPVDPVPVPTCTDKAAPKITAVVVAKRTATRAVQVSVTGTDDCKGITHIAVSGAILGTAKWSAGLTQTVSLNGWNGPHSLKVVVRDGSGRTSLVSAAATTLALPQPTLRARSVARVAGTGCNAAAPTSRIAGQYRVIDRCARLVGSVVKIQRNGRYQAIQLLLPTAASQAIYTNAVGPVKIWVVTDRLTDMSKPVRAGRRLTFIGTLVAETNLTFVHGIPADVIIGP